MANAKRFVYSASDRLVTPLNNPHAKGNSRAMAGVNPALLAHLTGGAAAPAAPAPPTGGAAPDDAGDDRPEPVALHDSTMELLETVKSAAQMAEDLQSQAELADQIDPGAEKAIGQAAKLLAQVGDLLTKAETTLGDARKEHEEKMGGPGDSDADDPGYGG